MIVGTIVPYFFYAQHVQLCIIIRRTTLQLCVK